MRSKYTLPVNYARLTWAERREVRMQYIYEQGGRCSFCNGMLTEPAPKSVTDKWIDWSLFPEGFMTYPVHLQHCHFSGLTEGAVHNVCNAVLWQYHGK